MDNVTALAIIPCNHAGWSLWVNWWEWWCGNCGVTFPEFELLPFIDGHQPGDVHAP